MILPPPKALFTPTGRNRRTFDLTTRLCPFARVRNPLSWLADLFRHRLCQTTIQRLSYNNRISDNKYAVPISIDGVSYLT